MQTVEATKTLNASFVTPSDEIIHDTVIDLG